MTKILFVFALVWGYASAVGSFAYSDSAGHEYTGTYGDDEAPPPALRSAPFNEINGYGFPFYQEEFPDFGTTYFSHLERFLQEAFARSFENQNRAFLAAKKAFDLTQQQAFSNRFQPMFPNPPRFGPPPMFGTNNRMNPFANDAFASAAIGPGYRQQIAAINPSNPAMPNVFENVQRFSGQPKRNNFFSVSSSSYSTANNVDGKLVKHRGSETMVNDNGKVTQYEVNN